MSFASNDYLGLAGHPAVVAAAHAAPSTGGAPAPGASRLVVGRPARPRRARGRAGRLEGHGGGAVLPTGFAANLAVLATLAASPDVLVVSDELNHASIIDGCRLGRGQVAVARHGDVDHVDALLAAHPGPALVVTDTVFSMDGDEAPVDGLGRGVRPPTARCSCWTRPTPCSGPDVDLRRPALAASSWCGSARMSKALGSLGGFVAASRDVVDLLVNVGPPVHLHHGAHAGRHGGGPGGRCASSGRRGRGAGAATARATSTRSPPATRRPIIPIVLGDERAALDASAALLAQGLLVPAIRPPTVAPGTSRLRVALSAAHTDDHVERLVKALADLPSGSI